MINKIAVILARAGSKGVPGKNWMDFCGMPLVKWSIMAALEKETCDHVLVSSDSREIMDICNVMQDSRVSFVARPSCFCTDNCSSELAISHALSVYRSVLKFNDNCKVCFLQPTSPFRYGNIIQKCFDCIGCGESAFTAIKHTPLFWQVDKSSYAYPQYKDRKMRQEYGADEFMWHDCGNVYTFYAEDFFVKASRHQAKSRIVECDMIQSLQIDSHMDLDVCRKISEIEVVKKWMYQIAN